MLSHSYNGGIFFQVQEQLGITPNMEADEEASGTGVE